MRAAERRDAALRLELTEPCSIGCDDDVARQYHLDADRVGDAMHDGDHRLGSAPVEGERVDLILRDRLRRGRGTEELGHVQASGRVLARRIQDGDP
jgi:hypothetical protein